MVRVPEVPAALVEPWSKPEMVIKTYVVLIGVALSASISPCAAQASASADTTMVVQALAERWTRKASGKSIAVSDFISGKATGRPPQVDEHVLSRQSVLVRRALPKGALVLTFLAENTPDSIRQKRISLIKQVGKAFTVREITIGRDEAEVTVGIVAYSGPPGATSTAEHFDAQEVRYFLIRDKGAWIVTKSLVVSSATIGLPETR